MIYLLQENAIWFLGSVVAGAAITWFMSVRKVDVMVAGSS